MIPKLEEWMIVELENGDIGVVINYEGDYEDWWLCLREYGYGSIFSENTNDTVYSKITKLYKCKDTTISSRKFEALQFMINGKIDTEDIWDLVYDKNAKKVVKLKRKCKSCCDAKPLYKIGETIEAIWSNGNITSHVILGIKNTKHGFWYTWMDDGGTGGLHEEYLNKKK
jgi:hypothetical protein